MKLYSSKDVLACTGITQRNLKFWIKEYKLKTIRKGRTNYFNETVLNQLKIIQCFSNNKYFTARLLAVYLQMLDGKTKSISNEVNELKIFMNNIYDLESDLKLCNVFKSLFCEEKDSEITRTGKSYSPPQLPDELL